MDRPRTPPGDDGWTLRFTASGARLAEAVDNYRALGFEVRLEPSAALDERAGGPGCDAGCAETIEGPVMAIFTRRCEDGAHEDRFDDEGDE